MIADIYDHNLYLDSLDGFIIRGNYCTPPSLAGAAGAGAFAVVVAALLAAFVSAMATDNLYATPRSTGQRAVIVSSVVVAVLVTAGSSAFVYHGGFVDYGRCTQRERVTVSAK